MLYLEDQFTLTIGKQIQKAISIVDDCNKHHPICDYLNGLEKRRSFLQIFSLNSAYDMI